MPPGRVREEHERAMRRVLRAYRMTLARHEHPVREFRYVNVARTVVGVGSAGTRCRLMLMVGRDDGDPLILQAKEARPSVLERFAGKSRLGNSGRRVVAGQRLMQAAGDIFLGWVRVSWAPATPSTAR